MDKRSDKETNEPTRRGIPTGLIAGAVGIAGALAVRAAIRNARAISFEGRVVLITGGSRGLGLCLAREFARQGASLALAARDPDELGRAEAELKLSGTDVYTVVCDVTDEASISGMIQKVTDRFGRLDALVNNAGMIRVGPLETMTTEDFDDAMKTHFWGPLYCCLEALPWLRKATGARIVNIASIGGLTSVPHLVPYSASKFALVGLSEGLRSELASEGITVTTVCPGLMRTGSHLHAEFKGQHRKEYTLFTLFGAVPGNSISAEGAARRIVDACRVGDAEVVLGIPAKFGALFHGLFPGLTSDIWGLANRLLPRSGGIGTATVPGKESETRLTRSWLTTPLQRAAARNNEEF
jgi:NAD(P)-dependent dehydrogenase (short-subunit alcohol dehydrogenase family)